MPKRIITLKNPPIRVRRPRDVCKYEMVKLNDREYVVFNGMFMFKYSLDSDKWTLFLELPANSYLSGFSMVSNDRGTRLYLAGTSNDRWGMLIIDVHPKSKIHKSRSRKQGGGTLVNVKDTIQKIKVDGLCIHHTVWNATKRKWKSVPPNESNSAFEDFLQRQVDDICWVCVENRGSGLARTWNGYYFGKITVSLMYVAKQNAILMFCGMEWLCGEAGDKMYVEPLGIWRYSIDSKQWKQMSSYYDFGQCSFVLTADQKQVIVFGAFVKSGCTINRANHRPNRILVINIDGKTEFKMTRRRCLGRMGRFVSGARARFHKCDQIVTVRSGGQDYQHLLSARAFVGVKSIPLDIKRLIKAYCSSPEMIHWIGWLGNHTIFAHEMTSLERILDLRASQWDDYR